MREIMGANEYEEVEHHLVKLNGAMVEFETAIKNALNAFETNTMVQEFYSSGKYGTTIAERLRTYRQVVNKYVESLSTGDNSLVVNTKRFVSNQIDLLMSQSVGYTRTDSYNGRREGNRQWNHQ